MLGGRRFLRDDWYMGRLLPLFVLIDIALIVIALIDCLSSDESEIRALPKVAWVFIILLFAPIGPIVWFVAGRPQRAKTANNTWSPGSGFPESSRPNRRRPIAPDDDPEFLRGIAKSSKEDDEMFRRWEEDLRRREDELRRKQQDEEGPAKES
jgi:hypothetical protein